MNGSDRLEDDVTECQECGGEIDFTESGPYWKTADERFWHDDCYDLIGRIEDVAGDLERLIESVEGGKTVSNDLEISLKKAHDWIDVSVRQELVMKDQKLGVYNTGRYRGEPWCRTCKLSREITGSHQLCPDHGSTAIVSGDLPSTFRSGGVKNLERHLKTTEGDDMRAGGKLGGTRGDRDV